jgi:translation initiation factor IF-2
VPTRIYAFAKELGLDNKALLDICEKVGIKGKGSALASMDDDEIAKVKEFLTAETHSPKPPGGGSSPEPLAPRREETIAPRRPGPIRDLDQKSRRPEDGRESRREPPIKRTTVVKLAAMPEVKQPEPTAPQPEIKVQKPDISLPQDAIRKAKSGAAPLSQFTQTTKDKRQKKGKADGGPAPSLFPDSAGRKRERDKDREKRWVSDDEAGMGTTRQRRMRTVPPSGLDDGEVRHIKRRGSTRQRASRLSTVPRRESVSLVIPCTVRAFSEASGISAGVVCKTLMDLGLMVNINAQVDNEMAHLLAEHFNVQINLLKPESAEDRLLKRIAAPDDPDLLSPRPPVVTFLGHVDHGKTSLLDAIIGINVVAGEAGGITQHIRAYEIAKDDHTISFVDTPGHAAFTEMRARGANVTDIAVLVVAADDGVMPQTEEAISHIKAANVPIIVALNKIDLSSANVEKCYQDLAANDLLPSEWGGDVEVVKTSATKGTGIDQLLETILVTAELHEYKANPDRPAYGTCLEAEQDSDRGVIAKVLVQNGTLHVGDIVVCGAAHGRIKAMFNTLRTNRRVKDAGPSIPVNITGLDCPPQAGDKFYVLDDIAEAREIATVRGDTSRQTSLSGITTRVSLEEFQRRVEAGTVGTEEDLVELNLILRADVRGSIEAIQKELRRIDHPEIRINILQALVGGISAADVRLAQASNAVIIGFNVVPDDSARSLADDVQVEIRRYDIIYKITDDIIATLEGRLKPDQQIVELGAAMVLRTFSISRVGTIAGCRVVRGTIQRDCRVRVIRDSRVIGDYPLESLRREKDDAREVQRGMECGIKLSGFNDIKEGDQLEAYKVEEVARKL